MKYLVICDLRENFKNYAEKSKKLPYNDHPDLRNLNEIIEAVISLGYDCEYFGGVPELIDAVKNKIKFSDSCFLNFTDGMSQNYSRVQAPVLLDILDAVYSGSDVFPSVLMNNKHFCKQTLHEINVLMPESFVVNKIIPLDKQKAASWGYPLFIKPNCEGSSLGISSKSVCHTLDEVIAETDKLTEEFGEVIVEKYVSGIDITNYLIGNNNLYYINDIITAELFDTSRYAVYGAKEKSEKLRTLYFNDEKIPTNILEEIRHQSVRIAKTIGARDICRIDYRYQPDTGKFYFIEINSAPRFSSTSEIGFIAARRHLTFRDMIKYYIQAFQDRLC